MINIVGGENLSILVGVGEGVQGGEEEEEDGSTMTGRWIQNMLATQIPQ